MAYTATQTALPGVLVLEPKVFADARGFFYESFNAADFQSATGVAADFVQDNHSRSAKSVLRGLHYQIQKAQGKLVRVTAGSVQDIVVDMRKSSPHFGKHASVILSAENRLQLWVPPGFAHGFLVLSDGTEFLYKTTDYWHPEHERTVLWNDADLMIDWQLEGVAPVLAAKDQAGTRFADAEIYP